MVLWIKMRHNNDDVLRLMNIVIRKKLYANCKITMKH